MSEISAQNICLSFGENEILKDLSFEVFAGERVGLVGPNGCGKSTLLKVIAGELSADSGFVAIPSNRTVGMLKQLPDYPTETTVRQVLWSAFEKIERLGEQLRALEGLMAEGKDIDMHAYGLKQTAFEAMGGYELDVRYNMMTNGLRITPEMQDRSFMSLSGGEKTRVSLARLMLSGTDILLLDEPTNHLDIDSIEWLENWLVTYKGAVLIVSHDRYFLDKVTTRTLELYDKAIVSWPGNYSYFAERRDELAAQLESAKRRQDKEIARLSEISERMKGWGMGNKKVMKKAFAIQKRVERMERIKTLKRERKMSGRFSEAERSGDEVFNIEHLTVGHPPRKLIEDFSAMVLRGERIAIVGPNGCGKTTMLEVIMREQSPMGGYIFEGTGVKKGYLPQVVSFRNPYRNILDTMLYETGASTQQARDRLAVYDFRGEEVFKEVSVLSGGEKTRLQLCLFMGKSVNTLFLDEPTNHLDILSRQWVEDAIDEYSETLIFVSHDRYFIDRFATRIWLVENGQITDFDGGWEALREMLRRREIAEKAAKQQPAASIGKKEEKKPQKNSSQKEKKQLAAKIAAAEKRLEQIDAEMEEYASDYVKLGELFEEKEELEMTLLELYEQSDV
ncbi:MAG: ATP-binding cassette domain-containing protein [Clostridia bacterium]|nr:ATP-binding cassette domain-containing protein [Clostridia bacterium]